MHEAIYQFIHASFPAEAFAGFVPGVLRDQYSTKSTPGDMTAETGMEPDPKF